MNHIRSRWRQYLIAVTGAGVALAVIVVLTAGVFSAVVSRNNNEALGIIKDCTEVQGECNRRNQAATAQVVFNINRVSIYAAACASRKENAGSVAKVQACVLDRMQQDSNNDALRERTGK